MLITEDPESKKTKHIINPFYTLCDNNIVASLRMIFNRVIQLEPNYKLQFDCASLRYMKSI